jgi:hypothetical protein
MTDRFERARSLGIPVQDVAESYAHYMLRERQKLRDNPGLAVQLADRYDLAVTQERTATGVTWKTLGELPLGAQTISISASSTEAARNKLTLRELLEQRYRREFATALQRTGQYGTDLAGRRAAMAVAMNSSLSVAELGDVLT